MINPAADAPDDAQWDRDRANRLADYRSDWQRGILAEGWQVAEERRESLMAALGHAIDFWT